ncbi:MAG: ZIP family metal transporter [Acholeplasmatales bacterium]|jgi:ZIP family zinc transporter|nr:ZIP family metal transporter [Acholeplasmatales bacterium]
MDKTTLFFFSISIIFLATTVGSAFVFFFKKSLSPKLGNIIIGFASGIMFSAAIFGLLIPSINEGNIIFEGFNFIYISIGFLLGGLLLFALDKIIPHFHTNASLPEGPKNDKITKNIKFFLAVTIHNIPEGLAVGFAVGLAFLSNDPVYIYAGLSLSIGIAIQNIPEGSAVSISMFENNFSKKKSFLYGTLSGIVEPLFAVIGFLFQQLFSFMLPILLAFAAGAMIYVTVDELLPEARQKGFEHYGIWSFMFGFLLMLILEITI